VDRDDAIAEALDALHGTTRAELFRRAGLGSAALLAASAAPAAAAIGGRDEAILNYALTLEYVQDSFYWRAGSRGRRSAPTERSARGSSSTSRGAG
jgi:hypothetical protein